jgi:hypothetical protein
LKDAGLRPGGQGVNRFRLFGGTTSPEAIPDPVPTKFEPVMATVESNKILVYQ